jgi:hypothetical protein
VDDGAGDRSSTPGGVVEVVAPGATTQVVAPARRGSDFDLLFARTYPAVVGLARRVLDRDRTAAVASDPVADEVAVEALSRARVHHLRDTDRAAERIVGWAADLCLARLIGHPGHVALPAGARADDMLPADLLEDGVGTEWDVHGLALWELQEALSGARRVDRRVGVVCLGCGLPPLQTAALLGLDLDDVTESLGRIGVRLADRRRVSAEVESPLDARLGDQ